eukprot:IDg1782t1
MYAQNRLGKINKSTRERPRKIAINQVVRAFLHYGRDSLTESGLVAGICFTANLQSPFITPCSRRSSFLPSWGLMGRRGAVCFAPAPSVDEPDVDIEDTLIVRRASGERSLTELGTVRGLHEENITFWR